MMRGIRGATVASENTKEAILSASLELLKKIIELNPSMNKEDICSVIFTLTEDLDAVFPAQASRELDWDHVPLMCAREIPVPGSLPKCIRVLVHWNTSKLQSEIRHVYLKAASTLRPDLIQ